jgi:ATP-binding cassette, subfamily B, bacterial PglK
VIKLLTRLPHLFEKKDSISFFLLGLAILMSSFLEVLGIGLLIPFVALLGKPDFVNTNQTVHRVYEFFHFQSFPQFMIAIAITVMIVFILKGVLVLFLSYWQVKFVLEKKVFLKTRLFRAYLLNPYTFHLKSDLARMQRNLELVDSVMNNSVLQLFYIMTEMVLVVGLFFVLLWRSPVLTLGAACFLGGIFFLFVYFTKDRLRRWGEISNRHRVIMYQQMNQGLGSIKEVKIFGKEDFFADRYDIHSRQFSWQEIKAEIIGRMTKPLIESLIVGLVMLLVVLYFWVGKPSDNIFLTLSLFVVVSVRLMPSMNRISSGWAAVRNTSAYFDEIYDDLIASEQVVGASRKMASGGPVAFQHDIRLEEISFNYEDSAKPALDRINLMIPRNATVGFVGPSGAGKTTAIDIITGILSPAQGRVLVDGADIHSGLRGWQDQIGYIPQAIYLCNDTIRQNVAFGIEPKDQDEKKVWQALRLAQLEEFVSGLPDGLETEIGERGVRLSGGQRQRIGIARALYNDPQVLVMDEATAALDNETERDFMESLAKLSGSRTILIIAHRLTTVRACDIIFFLKDGRLVDSGTYDDLIGKCPEFRNMANIGISVGIERS